MDHLVNMLSSIFIHSKGNFASSENEDNKSIDSEATSQKDLMFLIGKYYSQN